MPASPTKRPHILFIMADDMGYADLSCFGRRDYATPQIDRLAAQGMRLTSAYANSPVCSATRTALITGRYQYRLRGAAEWHSNADEQDASGYQGRNVQGPWRSSDHDPLLLGFDK